MSGEIRDPERTVPRAAWIAGLAIAAFYILGTLAILVLIPAPQVSILSGLVQAGQAAGAKLHLEWMGWLLVGLVLLGVAGQLGAWIGGAARVPFVIGVDRYLPAAFARLHPRWKTPYIGILVQAAVCTAALFVAQAGETLHASYQLLVDLTVITYFIPFLYLFAAAWKLAGRMAPAAGMAVTGVAIVFSLLPPSDTAAPWLFEAKVIGGTLLLIAAGRLCFNSR